VSNKRIRVITHPSNQGYGATIKSGLYASKYPWIAFIDSDGQFNFAEITDFIKKQEETGADLVIGYYKKRQVSVFKIVTSKLWELTVFVLFGLKVRDIDCGFKLISKEVIDNIPLLESQRGAFISSELLVKAKRSGFKIVEVPVTHYPRLKGVGTGRNLNVIIKSFIDLLRLWKKLH
jgi:glycosyltransferase involved in cell wall biosynthesis